jgi:hypothetical protein
MAAGHHAPVLSAARDHFEVHAPASCKRKGLASGFALRDFASFSGMSHRVAESGGSIGVRTSVWVSGIRYLQAGAPEVFPEGTRDPYHFLRRAIGYGPENTWLPESPCAAIATELQSANGRSSTVDIQNLMTIGFAGSAASSWSSGRLSVLFGFWDLPQQGREKLFCPFRARQTLALSPHGWPELLVGYRVESVFRRSPGFCAWSGFQQNHEAFENSPRQLFVLGISGGLIAHVIETGRLWLPDAAYFYLFLALLSVLGARIQAFRCRRAHQSKVCMAVGFTIRMHSRRICILALSCASPSTPQTSRASDGVWPKLVLQRMAEFSIGPRLPMVHNHGVLVYCFSRRQTRCYQNRFSEANSSLGAGCCVVAMGGFPLI